MTGNKKIMCKVCCREMRSDVLARHMKQHSSTLQSTAQICKDIVLELVDKVLDMQSAPTTKRKFGQSSPGDVHRLHPDNCPESIKFDLCIVLSSQKERSVNQPE